MLHPREATLVVEREGRDKGGVFVLREKPAYQASEWFMRATQLLVRSGVDVPPDIFRHGAVGFVTIGIGAALTGLGRAPWNEVKPLLDELLACIVSYQPPGAVTPQTQAAVIKGQIAEPATFLWLYEEVSRYTWVFRCAPSSPNFERWQRWPKPPMGRLRQRRSRHRNRCQPKASDAARTPDDLPPSRSL